MKTLSITLILWFIVSAHSGPLAAGVWTACMKACSPLAAAGPWGIVAAIACWAACGPAGSVACFADNTSVISPKGIVLLSELKVGDFVLTSLLEGKSQWTQIKYLNVNESDHKFVQIKTQTREINVTIDHVMISGQHLIQAKNLKIGE